MTRMGRVGLCVLVAVASTAVAAPGAQAAQYGQCVSKAKGKYSDPNCQTASIGASGAANHEGRFEWRPGPPPSCVRLARKHGNYADASCATKPKKPGTGRYETAPGPHFRSQAFGVTIATSPTNTVECKKEVTTGEVTGLDTELDSISVLEGCSIQGNEALTCSSKHARAGSIDTLPLQTRLIGHGEKGPGGEEPAPGQVWTELSGTAANKGEIADFGCGASRYRLRGSMSGPTSYLINVMGTVSMVSYGRGAGEQGILAEFSPTGTTWTGPNAAIWQTERVTDFLSHLEIKNP